MSEHAIREYLKTIGNGSGGVLEETDPVFTASPAHGISSQDIADWNDKQDELVSGTNIKTINGQSLLGSGDLPVAPPVTSTDVPTADTISEFDSDAHMNSTDMTAQDVSDFVDGLNVQGSGWEYVPLTSSNPSMYINPAGGYYKLGRLVVVQCRFYVTGTFPAGDYNTVTGGLPVPSEIQASLGVTWNYADSATHASAVVSSTGSLVVQSGSKALTASTLFITGAYIAE